MKKLSFSSLQKLLGIDFGSSIIRIWSSEKPELIISQPSCIAVDTRTSKVLAVGQEASSMEGRVSSHIAVIYPIQNGVVYDFDAAKALIKVLIQQHFQKSFAIISPSAIISVPANATEAEKQIFSEVVQEVGVKEVLTIAQPLAASIGAGVPIADASGSFIMQMGGGVVETAIISLGSQVAYESVTLGGVALVDNIRFLLKQDASLDVSKHIAQQVLQKTITVQSKTERKQLIAGQNTQTGNPLELELRAEFFQPMIDTSIHSYLKILQKLLNRIPPELTGDIIDKGLLLSGGLAQLHGLDDFLVSSLGIPVSVVDNPEESVIKGIITALDHLELFKESLGYMD